MVRYRSIMRTSVRIQRVHRLRTVCRLFLTIIVSLALTTPATGLNFLENASFRSITINEGLSQNFVSSVAQDIPGFIWIGTKDGLNRYDGYRFTVFRHDPFDPYSISDNFIKAIYCDSHGRLWIGTINGGLNVYDSSSGRFYHFRHNPDDVESLSSDNVQAIVEDMHGDIWVGTNTSGLSRIRIKNSQVFPTPDNARISRVRYISGDFNMENASVLSLTNDRFNALWIGTSERILTADVSQSEPAFQHIPTRLTGSSAYIPDYPVESPEAGRSIFEDGDGGLWMLNRFGLFRYNREHQLFTQFRFQDPDYNLFRSLAATSFFHHDRKEIWVSKEDKLVIIDVSGAGIIELDYDRNRKDWLQKGHLISLFADKSGTMWIGSNGYGITLYDPYAGKFVYPENHMGNPEGNISSSRDLSMRSFCETSYSGNFFLWLGTNEGFFRVNRTTSGMERISVSRGENSDVGLIVYSIAEDEEGILWLGSSWGLISYNQESRHFKIHHTMLTGPEDALDPRVAKVHLSGDEIWVLTPNTIALFNKATETFDHIRYNSQPVNRFREMVFPALYEDPSGNFWVGTPNGLQYFEVSLRRFTRTFVNEPDNPLSLGFNDIRAVIPDPYRPGRYLWLATAGMGINRFDLQEGTFRHFTESEGLSNNMVYGMLSDDTGNFWLSTNNGLSRFSIQDETFTVFTSSDGLQSNEFNSGAFYRSGRGEMFFGGIKGYNSFMPASIEGKQYPAPVVFTAFNLLNDAPKTRHRNVLKEFVQAGNVILPYSQNFFNIEFASLDFFSNTKKSYSYSFTRKGENWIGLGGNNTISFSDVKPGSYILRIRGTNSDGILSSKEAVMQIMVKRPYWAGIPAFIVYLLLILLAGMGIRRFELVRMNLRNRVRMADLENQKQKEVNQIKSQFFANISHEFRTPLTLIRGPLEQMIGKTTDPEQRMVLGNMYENAGRLLHLINQLLDLSKLENRQYPLRVAPGDIGQFLKGYFVSFSSLAQEKNIEMNYVDDPVIYSSPIAENFFFDRDAMQKIICNLVSNSLKFTPESGKVSMGVGIVSRHPLGKSVAISVSDTGIGIPADKLPYIYDRFYQADESSGRMYEGWGIGLAYVRELVETHQALIEVDSTPGAGTKFTLYFPVGREHYSAEQIVAPEDTDFMDHLNPVENQRLGTEEDSMVPSEIMVDKDRPLILVVEDHSAVRRLICESLGDSFQFLEASRAIDGLKLAFDHIPDVIISDVIMPGMDGLEFCEAIRTSEKTSHTPLVLLTARASDEDKVQGIETGADAYLTKPFNTRELLAVVKNLVDSRRILREKFRHNSVVKPSEISVSSRDRLFVEKMLGIVETHIANEKFSVEHLAEEAAMSQAQLHRKLKAIVNQSASQFIRAVRMQRAKELLEKDAGNISEIAYMVGYGDPGYFTRTFRTFYDMLPSDVRKNIKVR